MADDQEKTEDILHWNEKETSYFFYANRYGTKEKSKVDFSVFF